MLTQQRNLNVIADNLTNVSTAGYKESRYLASTFDDVMYSIVGNKKKEYTEIGRQSYIRANDEIYVSFDQGIPEPTDIPLDFAIYGDGFFAIEGDNGRVYTRAGSFFKLAISILNTIPFSAVVNAAYAIYDGQHPSSHGSAFKI